MSEVSNRLTDTEKIARDLIRKLESETKSKQAVVVALYGDLGAGKTAFAKGIAEALGLKELVTSPTFVIEKIYKLKHKHFDHLIHIDCYRLKDAAELKALGFKELVRNPKNIIVIEWPEMIEKLLPGDTCRVHLSFVNEKSRDIYLQNG